MIASYKVALYTRDDYEGAVSEELTAPSYQRQNIEGMYVTFPEAKEDWGTVAYVVLIDCEGNEFKRMELQSPIRINARNTLQLSMDGLFQ